MYHKPSGKKQKDGRKTGRGRGQQLALPPPTAPTSGGGGGDRCTRSTQCSPTETPENRRRWWRRVRRNVEDDQRAFTAQMKKYKLDGGAAITIFCLLGSGTIIKIQFHLWIYVILPGQKGYSIRNTGSIICANSHIETYHMTESVTISFIEQSAGHFQSVSQSS